jgi:alpha-glucuronidase
MSGGGGGEVSYTAAIIANLEKLAVAFTNGDPGIKQWLMLPLKSPQLSGGLKTDKPFDEATLLKGKFDETSEALLDRIGVLQKALMGVADVATDIRKALANADDAAVNAAVALIPSLIEDVLKTPLPDKQAGQH